MATTSPLGLMLGTEVLVTDIEMHDEECLRVYVGMTTDSGDRVFIVIENKEDIETVHREWSYGGSHLVIKHPTPDELFTDADFR